jgi:cullin 1
MTINSGNILNLEEAWAIAKKGGKHDNITELEEGWAVIYKAILQLRSRLEEGNDKFQVTAEEYTIVYTIVYNMCNQNVSEEMYDRYKDSIKEYIDSMVLPALREQIDDQLLLRELVKRWNIHKAMVHWMNAFFKYLDRYFIKKRSLPALREVGIMYFRDLVFPVVRINVKNAVIALIDQERERQQTDGTLLKDVVGIFVELDMDFYTNDFEVAMLEHTGAYYSRKAVSWILEDSYTDYMLRIEECLIREKEIVARYLHRSSEQKVLDKVENGLLCCYMTHFLEDEHSGCLALLRDRRNDDLLMMQTLFDRIPNGWDSIANIFKQYVMSEVTPLVKQAEDALNHDAGRRDTSLLLQGVASFVEMVIELRDKHMKYAVDVFQHRITVYRALKEVFEVFCNKVIAGTASAEWLATLCHSVLKKDFSKKMLSRDEIIENVVEFLDYISDKDMFAQLYRERLAQRFLFDKIASVDLEQSTLSKLMQKCRVELTSKTRGMLTDLTRSRESQSRFETYLNNNRNSHPGIEFTVTVLTTGFWPTFKSYQPNVPSELVRCVEVFKDFYSTETQHRQLTWIYSWGTCTIIGRFDGGPIEMIATTCQTAILLLFNASEKLSYSNIRTHLNLADEEIVRLLYSLACAKYKIILKNPDTTTVSTADDFEINLNFTDKTGKVKIPMPLPDEKTHGTENTYHDRGFVIDASIVRIMKLHKVLHYKQLVSECRQQIGRLFNSDLKEIKERIEILIGREYLERARGELDILRYIP